MADKWDKMYAALRKRAAAGDKKAKKALHKATRIPAQVTPEPKKVARRMGAAEKAGNVESWKRLRAKQKLKQHEAKLYPAQTPDYTKRTKQDQRVKDIRDFLRILTGTKTKKKSKKRKTTSENIFIERSLMLLTEEGPIEKVKKLHRKYKASSFSQRRQHKTAEYHAGKEKLAFNPKHWYRPHKEVAAGFRAGFKAVGGKPVGYGTAKTAVKAGMGAAKIAGKTAKIAGKTAVGAAKIAGKTARGAYRLGKKALEKIRAKRKKEPSKKVNIPDSEVERFGGTKVKPRGQRALPPASPTKAIPAVVRKNKSIETRKKKHGE